MGGAVFPPCCLTWDQTMVEVMKTMVIFLKRSWAHTDTLSAPKSVGGCCQPTPLPESKRLFYTSVSLLLSRIQGYHYHLSKFHIYTLVYWRRGWQTTSVFLPWEPHDSMKRQNDKILKKELPRSVGAQYATGDQWRKNSRKNEGMEPKQKQYPAVDVTGDRSKVRCCKSNIA